MIDGSLLHGLLQESRELSPAAAGRVKGAAFDQALDRPAVDLVQVNTATEIEERGKRPALFPCGPDELNGPFAHVLDRGQSKADAFFHHGEVPPALIDVRRQDPDPKVAALGDVSDDLIRIAHDTGKKSGHELCGIMGLQISGLIRDQGIGRRMTFIETVTRKISHQVKDLLGLFLRDLMMPLSALDKEGFLLLHFLRLFLPHRPPKKIGLTHRKPGQHIGDLHDLFLIDDNAVGLFEDLLQLRQFILHRDLAALPFDEVIHHPAADRAGTIKGEEGDEILESFRFQLDQEIPHPGALQLKHAGGLPASQKLIGFRIGQRQGHDLHGLIRWTFFIDEFNGLVNHGQGAQAQQVELDQPDLLKITHRVLCDDLIVGSAVERDMLC